MDTAQFNALGPIDWPPGIGFLNSIEQTSRATTWSRSNIYLMLERGELEAVKDGKRLLIKGASIIKRVEGLPAAQIGKKAA